MSHDGVSLTRRRLLGGLVTVGGAGAATGAGTMALFSDAESSTDNAVRAGTLTLGFGGSAVFDFATGLAPTQSTTASVTLERGGSLAGSLDVDVDYTENDDPNDDIDVSAQALAESLTVETLTYGGTDLTGQIAAGGPTPTLHDLATTAQSGGESTPNDLVDLADPGSGTTFTIELRLGDVSNDYQGDGLDVDVTFHLNQHDGQ